MSLDLIGKRFRSIARDLQAPANCAVFQTKPRHDGSAHCEYSGGKYQYIVTERGLILKKKSTDVPDEMLFWLVSDMTFKMAVDYELSNRSKRDNPNSDGRRIWFPYHVKLLRGLNDSWADKQAATYAEILKDSPFENE